MADAITYRERKPSKMYYLALVAPATMRRLSSKLGTLRSMPIVLAVCTDGCRQDAAEHEHGMPQCMHVSTCVVIVTGYLRTHHKRHDQHMRMY